MARADRQQLKTIRLPAKRGEIVDRAGRVLAYSVDADTIAADPSDIEDPDSIAQLVCDALDDCEPAQQQLMAERLRGKGQFAYLARWVSPEEARRVKALDLQGLLFFKESRRYYPKKELAAHVLGYVGVDNGSGGARIDVRRAHPRPRGQDAAPDRRAAARDVHARGAPADRRRRARADDRRVPAAHRRARAAHRRRRERGRRRHRDHHAAAHRRDPRPGELADVQPERLQRRGRRRAAQPRRPGSVRAGLDVQGRHRLGRDRRTGDRDDRSGRLRSRVHRLRQPRRFATCTRTARCRSSTSSRNRATSARSGWGCGSARSASAVTSAGSASARRSRRTSAARTPASSGTRRGWIPARWRRCRWDIRWA